MDSKQEIVECRHRDSDIAVTAQTIGGAAKLSEE